MDDYSTKSVCVYDNGLFVSIAQELSKSFGRVYYTTPWSASAFPKSNARLIGQGIPGITWIEDIFDVKDKADVFCFPDCYSGPLQEHFAEDLKKRVFGSKRGDELELYREAAKEHFKSLNLPVGKYKVIYGLENLRKYLKAHENQYVKIEVTRGDMESFHAKNYHLIEPKLDELDHMLGALTKVQKFIVEDAIDDAVEAGIDSYTVDGKYPNKVMTGIEIKDKGYIAIIKDYKELPDALTEFTEAISPTLKQYKYRNFFSTENRITRDKVSYMNDFCARLGSPPSELYLYMLKNLPDIVWYGSGGEVVNPIYSKPFGAEVIIHSSWADKNWQAIEFPKSISDNIKLRNLSVIEGKYYAMPQDVGIPEIGAVVADGDTIEEAVEKVKKYCDQVEGYYLDIFRDSLDKAQEELKNLRDFGINLTEA